MSTPINIKLYRNKDGKTPFKAWITSLRDVDGRGRVNAKITNLKLGNTSNCEPVGEGVSELKIDFGPGYRVYFGKRGTALIILLCGSDKDDQDAAIKLAKKYWAEYRSRPTS